MAWLKSSCVLISDKVSGSKKTDCPNNDAKRCSKSVPA